MIKEDQQLLAFEIRRCTSCLADRPTKEFHRSRRDAFKSQCKDCAAAKKADARWLRTHPGEPLNLREARQGLTRFKCSECQGTARRHCLTCSPACTRARVARLGLSREWHAAHPDYGKILRLRKLYGLTLAELDQMVKAQAGRCLICQQETKLVVDHDHTTGRVRGLLCGACNGGLGSFRDNPAYLAAAIEYLSVKLVLVK